MTDGMQSKYKLHGLYRRHEAVLSKYVFPAILLIYPLLTIHQGVDVSDSTYSLSNFLYFPRMEGMWVVSTYLANVAGWLMTRLPFGSTLLGMNLYTGLMVSGLVLLVYAALRRWMPAWIVFVGEVTAMGFCWIPTGILYNYLTYFLMTLGTLLLYYGLVEEKRSRLVAAGVVLGANVLVRIPNLTQMALILGLWYYLGSKKETPKEVIKATGLCVAGYGLGILLPLLAVLLQYGIEGILEMITGLAGIQSVDASYAPLAMVRAVADAYARSLKWSMLPVMEGALGTAGFILWKHRFLRVKKCLYGMSILLLLRFLWGRGMFSFRYYEDYSSMYEWGMMGLYFCIAACLYVLLSAPHSREERLWAVLILVILGITPLGSNNYTYQNLNNLFLAAPFTLYVYVKLFRRKDVRGLLSGTVWPWKAMAAAMGMMILLQSMGFHLSFAFRDGMDGTPRNTKTEGIPALAGMWTTEENGRALEGLYGCVREHGLQGREVILYGDCPGLSFLLRMPFALENAWPDLDSFPVAAFRENLEALEERPVIIIRGGMQGSTPGSTTGGIPGEEKRDLLLAYIEKENYGELYRNHLYTMYTVDTPDIIHTEQKARRLP